MRLRTQAVVKAPLLAELGSSPKLSVRPLLLCMSTAVSRLNRSPSGLLLPAKAEPATAVADLDLRAWGQAEESEPPGVQKDSSVRHAPGVTCFVLIIRASRDG